jgi:Flp pilus assembly secretin CpaC
MKHLPTLIAAAAAAILAATSAQAAPKKVIENDIRVYTIDTYKSDDQVAGILADGLENNVIEGTDHGGAIYLGAKENVSKDRLVKTLRKVGKIEAPFTATLHTRSGKAVPISVGQTLKLADGATNGKVKTRDLETGFFIRTTPTTLKNGDIKVTYDQKIVELIDLTHADIAGSKIDLATVHQQAVRGSARLKSGSSMILASFSPNVTNGLFGRKNRIVVTVVTPRHL